MSRVFNMVGGIGNARLPAIYVTYPEGSLCICSKDDKTYTAKDTSGYWLFAGLEVGTWTVTATDGSQSVSASVEITENGQSVNITLTYELYIIQYAQDVESITGGWTSRPWAANNNLTYKEPTKLGVYAGWFAASWTGVGTGCVSTVNTIDLSNYDTISIGFKTFDNLLEPWFIFGVFDSSGAAKATVGLNNGVSVPDVQTVTLNIENITGNCYVGLRWACGNPSNAAEQLLWFQTIQLT